MELKLEFKALYQPPVIGVDVSSYNSIEERRIHISRMIADTTDKLMREQLIAMGWTPPPDKVPEPKCGPGCFPYCDCGVPG